MGRCRGDPRHNQGSAVRRVSWPAPGRINHASAALPFMRENGECETVSGGDSEATISRSRKLTAHFLDKRRVVAGGLPSYPV